MRSPNLAVVCSLAVLGACAASVPAPSPPPPPGPPPVSESVAPAPVVDDAPPSEPPPEAPPPDPLALAAERIQVVWLVAGPAGPQCLDWRVYEVANGASVVDLEHSVPGPCFTVYARLRYAVDGSTLRLEGTSYGTSGGSQGFGSARHAAVGPSGEPLAPSVITLLRDAGDTLQTSVGPWFRTQAACEAARDAGQDPLDTDLLGPDETAMVAGIQADDLPVPQVNDQALDRLRAMLRKREKRPSYGLSEVDHKRWPKRWFAERGLFSLEHGSCSYG